MAFPVKIVSSFGSTEVLEHPKIPQKKDLGFSVQVSGVREEKHKS
jgi:hypothetical protein